MSELTVLKDTRKLIKFVYSLDLPSSEKYNLKSQIRRASVSVALNIREGNSFLGKNKVRFFNIALGSLVEVDECLKIMLELDYCKNNVYDAFLSTHYWLVFNKLKKLISSISSTSTNSSEAKP